MPTRQITFIGLLSVTLSLWLPAVAHAASQAPALAETRTTLYHADAIGSVRLTTAETGDVATAARYTPYGFALTGSAWAEETPGFAGQRALAATGTHDFGARHYATTHARFLSPDPIRGAAATNLYTYALNNPLKYIDPDGRAPRAPRAPAAPRAPSTCGAGSDTDACEVGLTLLDMPDVIAYKLAYEMSFHGYSDWAAFAVGSAPYVAEAVLPWAWARRTQRVAMLQRQAYLEGVADLWIAESRVARQAALRLSVAELEALSDIQYATWKLQWARQELGTALNETRAFRDVMHRKLYLRHRALDELTDYGDLLELEIALRPIGDPRLPELQRDLGMVFKEIVATGDEIARLRIKATRLQERYLESLERVQAYESSSRPPPNQPTSLLWERDGWPDGN